MEADRGAVSSLRCNTICYAARTMQLVLARQAASSVACLGREWAAPFARSPDGRVLVWTSRNLAGGVRPLGLVGGHQRDPGLRNHRSRSCTLPVAGG